MTMKSNVEFDKCTYSMLIVEYNDDANLQQQQTTKKKGIVTNNNRTVDDDGERHSK